MRNEKFDGMIITGAPVEHLEFEDVNYWDEIQDIFNWTRTHVTSTLYICWAAQAGLYHHYGIPKYPLDKKMFGIFEHHICEGMSKLPIFRGFDDVFFVPHSRHTEVRRADIEKHPELTIISESDDSGVHIVMARGGREFYVTGHSEYSPYTSIQNIAVIWEKVCLSTCRRIIIAIMILKRVRWFAGGVRQTCCSPTG